MSQLPMSYLTFGESFLLDHAGRIIGDPQIALVELVANAWDAGADTVKIKWFPDNQLYLEIADNGIGMTEEEFRRRWGELNYNRRRHQGELVIFPPGKARAPRKTYGRNGKGRHGMFAFTDEYFVETTKGGETVTFRVRRGSEEDANPFIITKIHNRLYEAQRHGTRIWAEPLVDSLSVDTVRQLIGSKFIVDPEFRIFVNEQEVLLTDLGDKISESFIDIEGVGRIKILLLDTTTRSRTISQHGVAWWVNKRLVGDVDWKRISGESYLDGRGSEARRYTFIVEADPLLEETLPDWSGFQVPSRKVIRVANPVEDHIETKLNELLKKGNQQKLVDVLKQNHAEIAGLTTLSRLQVKDFADKLLDAVPSIGTSVLSNAVSVIAKMEKARTGYDLLARLSRLNVDEIDQLSTLLKNWNINEAMLILDELERRLNLIKKLESLVEDKNADELHQLQPLFEQGLWIFGPEYEAVGFTSNRQIRTVLRKFFKDTVTESHIPNQRPDFVITPNGSMDAYAADSYDERGEVNGIAKVVILELKRGGFSIGEEEVFQALRYANELAKSGKIAQHGAITAFVLGATLSNDIGSSRTMKAGQNDSIQIFAKTYSDVLRAAEARTFHLRSKIEQLRREQGGSELNWDSRPEQQAPLALNGLPESHT